MNETYIEATESEIFYAFAKSRTPEGHVFKAYHYWFSKNDAGLLGKRILFKIDSDPLPVPSGDASPTVAEEKQ